MRVGLNDASLAEWQESNFEYLRYEYNLSPDDTVLDIGAYQGEWAEQIFARYGCKIICIEPTEYIRGFKYGEVINKAAATYDGRMRFGGQAYYTSSSEPQTHEYECFDINSLLRTLPEVALMKMNIEGAEYDLLNHIIDAGLHTRIRNLQVQFHEIEGEPFKDWHEAIQTKLSASHSLSWFYPFCWENWGRNEA